jgi:hypothetical protein
VADFQKCVVPNCWARVPLGVPPVCSLHLGAVEPGLCVEGGDGATTARRFIPATDPECQESWGEPMLRPRRAVRLGRAIHEFGLPTA